MRWSDIQFQPNRRILRQFAGAWLLFLLICAAHQWLKLGHQEVAMLLAALGAGLGGLGLLFPPSVRWLYIGIMIVAFPIGWVVSQIIVALMYFMVVTPVAVFFRWRRRDVLHRRPRPSQTSFWTVKSQPEDVKRYFRQY